ncbi:MAG: V-type ATPase subunit [Clostridia bacterium]|nr:V-type ATPase subunit [Clostridia bacterium]
MAGLSQASNVLLTKSRAMYGKRLTSQNIADLLNCQTVSEVAAYLKNNTHYAYALRNIDDSTVHRGQLEAALDELFQREITALSQYRVDAGEYMRIFVVYQMQIREILKYLRLLAAGRASEYVFAMPKYAVRRDGFDPVRLAQAKDYHDFLRVISGTVFYKILRGMSFTEDGTFEYTMIEHALYSYLFQYAESVIQKHFHGRDREDLLGLLGTRSELNSFLHIYRFKKYYSACGEDMARSLVFDFHYKISKKTFDKMLRAESADQVYEIFRSETVYGRELGDNGDAGIDQIVNRISYKRVSHLMRFSTNPTVAVFSYMLLSGIERRDIVTIIEGVRYRVLPDEIKSMITIA